MFTRSNAGISNSATFFKADFIVYTEGGASKKPEESSEKNDDQEVVWAIDSIFWRAIFKKFKPNIRVKIKSLGSKENVRPYAEKIAENSINNTIATFDRDYSVYKNEKIIHPRILYTHGYSWENDACRPELLIFALNSIHPNGVIPVKDANEIANRYNIFLKSINRIVYVDLLCGLKSIEGVDRENFWGLIDTSNPQKPTIRKSNFFALIRSIKKRRTQALHYVGTRRINASDDCYGKMLSMFYYEIFCEFYMKITKCKNMPRHFADVKMAETMEANTENYPKEVYNHYEKIMATI